MNAQDLLRQAIDAEWARLRARIPGGRPEAICALVGAIDALPRVGDGDRQPDLVTGRRVEGLGANLALWLCLDATGGVAGFAEPAGAGLDAWAVHLLAACDRMAEVETVLAHTETGFMRIVANGDGSLASWIATRRAPASWRARADIDWWAGWLARRHGGEPRAIEAERPVANAASNPHGDDRRAAAVRLADMRFQLGYPADAELGGCTIQAYRDVLGALMARALRARRLGAVAEPQSETALIDDLAADLDVAREAIAKAMAGFTLDRDGAAYHAVPGGFLPPLVRVAPDRVLSSWRGLTTEPFFFLARELRRRDAQRYHDGAHLREGVFRDDLFALFADQRFVVSSGGIVLRREAGNARTDVDAAIFDRKSGALGLFELKSQDPFARSPAELARQRDNVLHASWQIGGILDWLQRHGADELLNRVDRRTAKAFRVRKVFPFVLGRYLVRFDDGPPPDRRAAWGTWPQVLRVRDGQPSAAREASPIASLFTRLRNDADIVSVPAGLPPRELAIGDTRLTIFPSYAAFRAYQEGPTLPPVT